MFIVSFETYFYKDHGGDLDFLPQSPQLIAEGTTGLYYVKAGDLTKLYKYTFSTKTDALLETRTHNIIAICIEDAFLWGVDSDGDTYDIWKLQLSDDAITEVSDTNQIGGGNVFTIYDLTDYGGEPYLLLKDDAVGTIYILTVQNDPPVVQDTQASNYPCSFSSGKAYGALFFLGDDEGNNDIYMLDYETGVITVNDSISGYSLPTRALQCIIGNETGGLLYFILTKDGDGLNYLCTYNTGTDIITDMGIRQDIVYEHLDFVDGASNSPWEYSKGYDYDIVDPSFYRVIRGDASEKIFNTKLGSPLGAGVKCVAILDRYAIDDSKNVWKYTEFISNGINSFKRARSPSRCWGTREGNFSHRTKFSADQIIEIWEFNDPTYRLCFRSKLGRAEYKSATRIYNYKCNNLGWDDLDERVSYVATAENVSAVVIALIGQLTNPYIYCDATSIPVIATPITYTFDNVRLRDALYVCDVLGNAYWWEEPNGYLYFRTYANPPASGDAYSYAAKNMSVPSFNILQVQHNDFSNIRGGWDNANNREFTPTTPLIAAHIQQYGRLLWRGRRSFAGAITQAALDAIVAGLKAWEGMDDNPFAISFYNKGKYYYPVGYGCTLKFAQISDLNFAAPENFIITECIIDFLRKGADYITVSNNITRLRSLF